MRVFATAEHPLAIFLDDLQWADPASLRRIGFLLGDRDSKHHLLLGAYRDNEVDAAHPLLSTLDGFRKAGVTLTEMKLSPLDLPTVTRLLAETLGKGERELRSAALVRALAAIERSSPPPPLQLKSEAVPICGDGSGRTIRFIELPTVTPGLPDQPERVCPSYPRKADCPVHQAPLPGDLPRCTSYMIERKTSWSLARKA